MIVIHGDLNISVYPPEG